MKKSIFLFGCLFTIASFFSFQSPIEVENIFQKSLEISQFKQLFEKDNNGEFLPLTIVSNGFLPENANLVYGEKTVQIVSSKSENNIQHSSFINVRKLKVKKQKSILEFQYGEKEVKVKLRRKEGGWVFNYLSIKGGGKNYVHIDTEF